MSYVVPSELPYGAFWCPLCLRYRACEVAAGESATDPDCALECITCNTRIGEAVDTVGLYPFQDRETPRSTLTQKEREAGRARGRAMVLGTFELPIPGAEIVKILPPPPPDFVAREAARISAMRGRK